MLQDYLTLRQAYLTRPDTRTQIHQNYVRNLFLYETFRLGGHNLPPTIFENIVSTGKPQSTETTVKPTIFGKPGNIVKNKQPFASL